MNIGNRIQTLRKQKGISQEELADVIGVSRQAVSKWESNQSMPDIDKIILLSDYFLTTTDYLLKGTEENFHNSDTLPEKKYNAMLFTIIGTCINAISLIGSVAHWIEHQERYSFAIAVVGFIIGTSIFFLGQNQNTSNKLNAKVKFYLINTWIILFLLLSLIFNIIIPIICRYSIELAPLPISPLVFMGTNYIMSSVLYLGSFVGYFIIYIAVCLFINKAILKNIN